MERLAKYVLRNIYQKSKNQKSSTELEIVPTLKSRNIISMQILADSAILKKNKGEGQKNHKRPILR